MSDEQTQDVEAQAREVGWVPQSEYTGDPAKFTPAEEYLRKGEDFLPYLKHDRKRLLSENVSMRQQLAALNAAVESMKPVVGEIQKSVAADEQTQAQGAIAAARRAVVEARHAGDVDAEIAAEAALDEAKARLAQATAKARAPATQPSSGLPEHDPHLAKFMADNPWFGKDGFKTRVAMGYVEAIKTLPEYQTMTPEQRYAKLQQEINRTQGEVREPSVQRTEGGSRGPAGNSGARTYANLPAEAKAICDRMGAKVVSTAPGAKFPTIEAYRAHYVSKFDWSN